MRPVVSDRMAVIVIVSAFLSWLFCITIIWGSAFEVSGAFTLRVIVVETAAAWIVLALRKRLLAGVLSAIGGLRLADAVPLKPILSGAVGFTREDNHKRMQVLAAAVLAGVGLFMLSTLWIGAATALFTFTADVFLFGDTWWWLLETVLLFAGLIPATGGLVAVLFATTVVRESGGRDIYGASCRDWLWAFSVAFGGFSLVWWFGINMFLFITALGCLLLFGAFTVVLRGELSTHPRRRMYSVESVPPGMGRRIALAYAVMAIIILWQLRLLSDMYGLDMSRRMIWVFLVVGILSYFVDRTDRKSRPPGPLQIVGAKIGVAATVGVQVTEILLCCGLDAGATFVTIMAILCQVPMSAFGATIMCGQRKVFAYGNGTAGEYISLAAGGLFGGTLFYWAAGGLGGFWLILMCSLGALIIAGALRGADLSRLQPSRTRWLAPAVAVSVSLIAAFVAVLPVSNANPGSDMHCGLWLTAAYRDAPDATQYREYILPEKEGRRSDTITRCLRGIMVRRRGKWWIAAGARDDVPDPATIPPRVYGVGSSPDPPAVDRDSRYYPPLSVSHPDYFRYTKLNSLAGMWRDYYDVVFIAPVPADHPHAWRCYNSRILKRCASMRYSNEGLSGLVLLRTQAGKRNVRNLLRVAQTYRKTLRSGWALVSTRRDIGVDMLLMGPAVAVDGNWGQDDLVGYVYSRVKNRPDHFLVPLNKLWTDITNEHEIRQVVIHSPPPDRLAGTPSIDGLRNYLQPVQGQLGTTLDERLREYLRRNPKEAENLFGSGAAEE